MSTATTVVNGTLPLAQGSLDELSEFQRVLKLRDDIFAGKHSRLTVPAHMLRKVSPVSNATQSSSHSSLPLPSQQVHIPGFGPVSNSQTATTASGIDPVLLTKSDDLIKAEANLHRNRLEKTLRDQFEQKRLDFRKKPAPAEAKPDFDLRTVLVKAQEVVKPFSIKDTSDKEVGNESVDENSFYSSRAPDSTPDRAEQSSSEEGIEQDDSQLVKKNKSARKEAISANKIGKDDGTQADADDEDEEGEYSPPEAEQYPAAQVPGLQSMTDSHQRQVRRYSDLNANKRQTSPNMRIVRNHITSPVAPQPSRVSPLAFAKDSLVSQERHQQQNGRQNGRAESPDHGAEENIGQRNKRRKTERKSGRRNARGVKQENISPPPFHDIQPLGAGRQPANDTRPIVIDDLPPPPELRYAPAPRYLETPTRPLSRQPEYAPLSEPRVASRAAMRPRDDQDLRRVASLHNLRLEQPREYVEYASPLPRAASYARVDSPIREIRYNTENDRPLQEIRVVRTPAPEFREIYQAEPEVRYIPEPMPPPPRERIVIDQYGRRFREIVQDGTPQSLSRSASVVHKEASQYQESYTPSRAGSVMIDERGMQVQPRYQREIPPLRQLRQSIDDHQQDLSPGHRPEMREMFEHPSIRRAGSVAVYERPQTQSRMVYADQLEERLPVRMASVRPPPSRYEDQPIIQNSPSTVRLGPREGTVFVDDRASIRREYLPVEQPRYQVVDNENMPPPQLRYVDSQGREVMMPSGRDDGAVRYVQRY